MLTVNRERSGAIKGVGANKLRVVLDGVTRDDVDSSEAREMATTVAAENGFGSGGLCDNPVIGPFGVNGEMLEDLEALSPHAEVTGFRAEFTFANRV